MTMKQKYKGFTISLRDSDGIFETEIEGKKYRTQTLDQAKKSVDEYLRAKKLLGKKVIGFSSADGGKVISTITQLRLKESEHWYSAPLRIYFIDEYGKELQTIGPFFEYSKEMEATADELKRLHDLELDCHVKRREIWEKLERID